VNQPSNRYNRVRKKAKKSFSDLALTGIEKGEVFLSKAKQGVKLYKRHPNTFKVGALATVGLLIYLSKKDNSKVVDATPKVIGK
jgi:precorrin-6x reductase